MIATTGQWAAAAIQANIGGGLAATPAPPGGGFDWNKVHPDANAVPKSDLFYTVVNGTLFLLIVASAVTLLGGAIAFGLGPVFGAHILSDRGKSMMWKAMLMALIAGSFSSIIIFLMAQ